MKLLNKTLALTLAAGLVSSGLIAMAADDIKVYVDGKQLEFDVAPIIENERTLVPIRAIFEALGAEVEWDQETATVTAARGDDTLKITIGSNILYINKDSVELDVPAKIIDERTLVPVRAISESFDAKVEWDGEAQSVIITTTPEQPTAAPSDGDVLPFDTLSAADMETLKERKEIIRYYFEQKDMPGYALNDPYLFEDMLYENTPELKTRLYDLWTETVAEYILYIQSNSDSVYAPEFSDDAEDTDILSGYDKILKEAGMDADSMFDEVYTYDTKAGTRVAVLAFKSADSMVQCKYLGIAASKDGKTRYFTAENDMMQPDTWFFCEVTEDSRGTLGTLAKQNGSPESFATLCADTFENNK